MTAKAFTDPKRQAALDRVNLSSLTASAPLWAMASRARLRDFLQERMRRVVTMGEIDCALHDSGRAVLA